MTPLRSSLAVLLLAALCAGTARAQTAPAGKLIRVVSPVAGQEVRFRVHVAPEMSDGTERIELVSATGEVRRADDLHAETPAELRLAPHDAFRVTLTSVAPRASLNLILPGDADRQIVASGSELVLVRRLAGDPVRLEAASLTVQPVPPGARR